MIQALYYTNWSIYQGFTPDQLPFEKLTHILYAFIKPLQTDAVLSDEWADLQKPMPDGTKGLLNSLKNQRKLHNPDVKILASVGGWSFRDNFKQLNVTQFVSSLSRLVQLHNFDGVDLDWEYPETNDEIQLFLNIIRELRKALPKSTITLAISASAHNRHVVDYRPIDHCVDFYNIMTYDFSGPWSQKADYHAALYPECDDAVRFYAQSISRSKLVMGIPLYGRSFANASKIQSQFSGQLQGEFEIGIHSLKALPLVGAIEFEDNVRVGAYCVCDEGLITYDNKTTVKQKKLYIEENNLAGVFFWEASGDNGLVEEFTLA